MNEPYVTADHRSVTDMCIATKNRRIGINDDIISDIRMTFAGLDRIAFFIQFEASCPDGYTLIQFDMSADCCGFSDDNTGTMVNAERFSNGCPWIDINTCLFMRIFTHDTWNIRDPQCIQNMGYTIDADGIEPWITKNNFSL